VVEDYCFVFVDDGLVLVAVEVVVEFYVGGEDWVYY